MTHAEAPFLPGLELSRILYQEAVRPVLDAAFPGLPYAAARIGPGSEVLGFDTARSADHDWGPRLDLFLAADDVAAHGDAIRELLADRLPKEIRGWPTHFRPADDPLDPVGHMAATDGPVDHRVATHDIGDWLTREAGFDATITEPAVRDWLAMPQQKLAGITGGGVFHDGPGLLTSARHRLARYPDQVWRYLLACQWQRISQEEAFVGRCAEVGDELGSAVVAARLVRDLMRLSLLLERRYAPYSKWLGSAFAQLDVAEGLLPSLRGALAATDHSERERHLCAAYRAVATRQNESGLVDPVDPSPRPYHGRPFLVLHAERFARPLAASVTDPELRGRPLTGAVDQWADSTELLMGRGGDALRAAGAAVAGS
ncbi:DUF4037 domain-containing protein [Streptomyces sp. RKAG290]|uniref:DUF4037 domain-containing protein n=1 Tax=Streptomyces sp. RKAG290 TaxID=2888348 RepID=UPI002034340A|nr:DUF4037 domain-containing protein [Streptomyces sp. RKAG290]MCM2412665.1 DUF4037 domain-containing protein [Streptomyces sp. RKAG290]